MPNLVNKMEFNLTEGQMIADHLEARGGPTCLNN